ncbi:MAG: hypothetical protein JW915_19365 [Chitinispirillaceae bacterium]|nr:hypothetical protein [Chitinispirillaceae bacterium]
MKKIAGLTLVLSLILSVTAQTKDAYDTGEKQNAGIIDPSRLTVNHCLSFGMGSNSGVSSMKSQSMYSTMLQYSFVAPVTVQLNFGLPIHSTFNASQNMNMQNMRSMDYFNSMPFDFRLTWQPTNNTNFTLSISKMNAYDYFGGYYSNSMWNRYPYFYQDREED